ncbi:hypothetical protein FRC12_014810 [Ceratobasidium sp. 428]|nr:hypothetical protein FRC12_014810 [Ceratobasidium sp. 428]
MLMKQGEREIRGDDKSKDEMGEILREYGRIRVLLIWFAVNNGNLLAHPQVAHYNSSDSSSAGRNGCTTNTCVAVLLQLRLWAYHNPHQRLCWLTGSPGTSKTAIAYSLCKQLENASRLAAGFFCGRWSPERRDVRNILPSIALQLAFFSRLLQGVILRTIIDQDVDPHTLSIQDQFEHLIATPLNKVGYTHPAGVVVIDALDECEDADLIDQILNVLLTYASNQPIKFLVTSLLEPYVVYRMQNELGGDVLLDLRLDMLDSSLIREDIMTFMEVELSFTYPSIDDLEHLANLSAQSFGLASVLVRYILRGFRFGDAERASVQAKTSRNLRCVIYRCKLPVNYRKSPRPRDGRFLTKVSQA